MSTPRSLMRPLPWVLLAASLAANGALLGRSKAGPDAVRGPRAPGRVRASRDPDAPASSRCEIHLARLQAAERARLAQALRWLAGGMASGIPKPQAEEADAAWRDDEDQEEALCRVAKRHLREHWIKQREALFTSLRRSLSNDEEQAKALADETNGLAQAAGLGPAQQEQLRERYAPLRRARLSAVLATIQGEAPANDAVLEEVLGLFADEDRLIFTLGGKDALRRLREGRCEGRTVIAAIAAALADLPWDESLRW